LKVGEVLAINQKDVLEMTKGLHPNDRCNIVSILSPCRDTFADLGRGSNHPYAARTGNARLCLRMEFPVYRSTRSSAMVVEPASPKD